MTNCHSIDSQNHPIPAGIPTEKPYSGSPIFWLTHSELTDVCASAVSKLDCTEVSCIFATSYPTLPSLA